MVGSQPKIWQQRRTQRQQNATEWHLPTFGPSSQGRLQFTLRELALLLNVAWGFTWLLRVWASPIFDNGERPPEITSDHTQHVIARLDQDLKLGWGRPVKKAYLMERHSCLPGPTHLEEGAEVTQEGIFQFKIHDVSPNCSRVCIINILDYGKQINTVFSQDGKESGQEGICQKEQTNKKSIKTVSLKHFKWKLKLTLTSRGFSVLVLIFQRN